MIYLDCAATSMQKPPAVAMGMTKAMTTMASPGRGGHPWAMAAAEAVYSCRCAVAELLSVPSPEQVVFTFNATHGLNIAINDLVSRGDRVVVSGYEHNSVMRPLHALRADIRVVRSPLFDCDAMLDGFARALPGARAAVCTAMSNVFGFITPIAEIASLCKQYSVPLIVDASQLAGCGKLSFGMSGVTYMAFPGHKGLLGPQGTGVLLCSQLPRPLLMGGTGSDSKLADMPELLPDGLEAGTHNVCGIVGLEAGVRYIQRVGVERIEAHERGLRERFVRLCKDIDGVETFSASESSVQGGVVSLRCKDMDCEVLADALGRAGIAVRGGMHCAPYAHETVGTYDTGTVRFSFSPFNTMSEVRHAAVILGHLVRKQKLH